ncbi:MAG TPA: glycine betaine ABC transporter substrate-binding protein [Solirubrobacteraceae bacterium]|jgi:osmoprotectant transport system substrate-binding protein
MPRLLCACLAAAVVLAACGGGSGSGSGGGAGSSGTTGTTASGQIQRNPANAKVALRIGSKNFTEQKVLGQIFVQGLAAAGYKTTADLGIGDERATFGALRAGRIDAYPEYTGTALLSFFGKRASQLPRDPQEAFDQAAAGFARDGFVAFPPTPFTNSNEVAVTKRTADRLHLSKISDLSRVAHKLVLAGPPECRHRRDCLVGLQQVYGLHFKRFMPVPIGERHKVLVSGDADVSIVFTTDPEIKRNDEVLLRDDRGMLPPYNSTLVMRRPLAAKAGSSLRNAIELLQRPLTDDAMQELDARVDLDHKSPAEVAREYLHETGLVKG